MSWPAWWLAVGATDIAEGEKGDRGRGYRGESVQMVRTELRRRKLPSYRGERRDGSSYFIVRAMLYSRWLQRKLVSYIGMGMLFKLQSVEQLS
jgi:hypothetical protein